MTTKPIKRNKNIIALSKDHHYGLLFCWKIRQGLKMKIELERIRNYINYFWDGHMIEHFREEEELLFSKVNAAVCNQGKDEHEIIRLLISGINGHNKDNPATYTQLVNLVDQHIRYEERVLFPYLEKNISEENLNSIGVALQNHSDFKDEYEDEFWVKAKNVVATS